jgi:hypothetical protein
MRQTSKRYEGGCHCGRVRFSVDLDLAEPASRCNCTLCTKRGAAGKIVKPDALTILTGEDALTEYVYGATQKFRFCKHCGIHPFNYGNLQELHGEYVAVNVLCLDGIDPATLPVVYWDGRHNNWQAGPRATPWPVTA